MALKISELRRSISVVFNQSDHSTCLTTAGQCDLQPLIGYLSGLLIFQGIYVRFKLS